MIKDQKSVRSTTGRDGQAAEERGAMLNGTVAGASFRLLALARAIALVAPQHSLAT